MSRKQKGSGFENPGDETYTYLSDKRSELATHWANPAYGARGGKQKKQRGGEFENASDVAYTYLSDKRSELATHWANPAYGARGGKQQSNSNNSSNSKQQKQRGGLIETVGSNIVSNKDMFGCAQKGGTKRTIKSIGSRVRFAKELAQIKLFQKGGKIQVQTKQKGGDCGCNQPMMLGGAIAKQKGAGFGYSMDIAQAITNKPEVARYSTGGAKKTASRRSASKRATASKRTKATVAAKTKKQKGGSAASDRVMEHFMDFQHRCRSTEIY